MLFSRLGGIYILKVNIIVLIKKRTLVLINIYHRSYKFCLGTGGGGGGWCQLIFVRLRRVEVGSEDR